MRNNFLIATFIFLISLSQYSCVSNNKSKRIIVASSGKIESLDPARANTLKSLQLLSSCLLYTSPSPRDVEESRMPSSA